MEYKKFIVDYKGCKIQAYTFGTGKKKIFSIPSYPFSGLYYIYVSKCYGEEDATFISFDMPGWVSNSENYFKDKPFNLEDAIEIVRAVVNYMNLENFSVIGYSFGGLLALRLAVEMKDNVKSLALISTIVNSKIIAKDPLVILLKTICMLRLAVPWRIFIHKWIAFIRAIAIERNEMIDFVDAYEEMYKNADANVLLDSMSALFSVDWSHYLDELNKMNMDTLIVNSKTEQNMFLIQSDFIRERLDDEKFVLIHGDHISFIINAGCEDVKNAMNAVVKGIPKLKLNAWVTD